MVPRQRAERGCKRCLLGQGPRDFEALRPVDSVHLKPALAAWTQFERSIGLGNGREGPPRRSHALFTYPHLECKFF